MYKQSRVASIFIFIYFIIAKIFIAVETQSFRGIGTALIFLYFYGKAIQGAFVFHAIEKAENPDYKAAPQWAYLLGIPAALIVLLLMGLGLMSTMGVVSPTYVQAGDEVSADYINTLKSNDIIFEGDRVDYFYSQGFNSILESGNILTQDRVILYFTDENQEIQVAELYFNEIVDVTLESKGNILNDSVYVVATLDSDRWLKLFLSAEQGGDEKFVDALREQLAADLQLPDIINGIR